MKQGSNTKEGYIYHDLPGSGLKSHRSGSEDRANFIARHIKVRDKTVLDIGCSVGGIAYSLARFGAIVDGFDYDGEAIKIGNDFLKGKDVSGRVDLHTADVTPKWITDIGFYDVVVWLSQWMWFVKQHGIEAGKDALFEISKRCNALVFDSAADDGRAAIKGMTQDKLQEFLVRYTGFSKIERFRVTDNWHSRDVFICSKPVFEWRRHRHTKVVRHNRDWVLKVNEKELNLSIEMHNDIKYLQRLQNYPFVPKLGTVGRSSYEMSYEGIPIIKLSDDDIVGITAMMEDANIVHRDIIPSNLVWNGKNTVLIDWAWAIEEGEITDTPPKLGENYKSPNGFYDMYSLKKIQKELNGR